MEEEKYTCFSWLFFLPYDECLFVELLRSRFTLEIVSGRADCSTMSAAVKSEKKKTICGACEMELEPDHSGIQCVQAHHFCPGCSVSIVDLFFSDPQHYVPLRCMQCHVELNPVVFERQLTNEQMNIYNEHMLLILLEKELLGADERLDSCPFCSFAVIRSKDDPKLFFCAHPDCGKMSCLICRKACPTITNEYCSDEVLLEMDKHFTCAVLAKDKEIFDRYLELGSKVPCPQCGLAGMKDDACTHMTCPTCSQLWCYFCGKKVEDCDRKENGTGGIFDHNDNWPLNPKRCPMYFTQITDIDERWPDGNEDLCLAVFHRNRSLRLLREVFEKLGEERINALDGHFGILLTCGFTLEEILHEDLTLIDYPANKSSRRFDRHE